MELTYYGGGCIYIVSKQLNVLVDPLVDQYRLKLPKLKADIVLYTSIQDDTSDRQGFIIASPGEYEMKNVLIKGISTQLHIDKPEAPKRGVTYTIEADDIHLLVTGNIAPQLSERQQDAIGPVNIMVVPVGGHGLTLDGSAAANLVSLFEPQYVIPVHYQDGKATYPMPQDTLDTFVQELGGESTQPVDKLKVTNKNLEEETKLIILKPH